MNLLVEFTGSSELTLIKNKKWISIIKQRKDPSNNKICKLDNKNKENQYQCELFMPKTQRFGFGFGSKLNQIWNPRFLTGHYEALDLQRQTSIEAHNASVRRRPMRMSYPSVFGWSFWEKRRRRIREREALKGFWRERESDLLPCKWERNH